MVADYPHAFASSSCRAWIILTIDGRSEIKIYCEDNDDHTGYHHATHQEYSLTWNQ